MRLTNHNPAQQNSQTGRLTIAQIKRAVAQENFIDQSELIGHRRNDFALARHMAMYLSRRLTGHSFPAIGRSFGGRHHSTIIRACQRIKKLRSKHQEINLLISLIEAKL